MLLQSHSCSVLPSSPKEEQHSISPEPRHTYVSFQLRLPVFLQQLLPLLPQRLLLDTGKTVDECQREEMLMPSSTCSRSGLSPKTISKPEDCCQCCFIPPTHAQDPLPLSDFKGEVGHTRILCSVQGSWPFLQDPAFVKPLLTSSISLPFHFLTPVLLGKEGLTEAMLSTVLGTGQDLRDLAGESISQ